MISVQQLYSKYFKKIFSKIVNPLRILSICERTNKITKRRQPEFIVQVACVICVFTFYKYCLKTLFH